MVRGTYKRRLVSLVIILLISAPIVVGLENNKVVQKAFAQASPHETKQKINVLVLYDNETNIQPNNISILEGYLSDLGWINLEYKTEIKSYIDLQNYDMIWFLGYFNFTIIKDFVMDYVSEGGSLLFLPPEENLKDFNYFTELFGVSILDEVALDNESYVGSNTTILVKDSWVSESPVLRNVTELAFPLAHPINITGTWNLSVSYSAYKLIWGMNSTHSESVNGSDIVLVAGIEIATGSKILIYSTSYIALNEYINVRSNKILLINSIRWLVDKLGYLKIDDVHVSGRKVVLGINSTIYVNFTVKDALGNPTSADAKIYIVRLGKVLLVVNANEVEIGYFEANVSFESIEPSTVELWIIVHKQYCGYYLWPETGMDRYEVVVYEHKKYTLFPDPFTTTLSLIVPILLTLIFIVLWIPKYRANKKIIEELEK